MLTFWPKHPSRRRMRPFGSGYNGQNHQSRSQGLEYPARQGFRATCCAAPVVPEHHLNRCRFGAARDTLCGRSDHRRYSGSKALAAPLNRSGRNLCDLFNGKVQVGRQGIKRGLALESFCAVVQGLKIQIRAKRDDPCWIDHGVAFVIMAFDMIEMHRLGDTGMLIQVAGIGP